MACGKNISDRGVAVVQPGKPLSASPRNEFSNIKRPQLSARRITNVVQFVAANCLLVLQSINLLAAEQMKFRRRSTEEAPCRRSSGDSNASGPRGRLWAVSSTSFDVQKDDSHTGGVA